uniref:Uncharacterized protein n=1 Tax=Cacopsylla melanoneura TaxID=428564 RepID=A0A8D8RQS1_9HEMI
MVLYFVHRTLILHMLKCRNRNKTLLNAFKNFGKQNWLKKKVYLIKYKRISKKFRFFPSPTYLYKIKLFWSRNFLGNTLLTKLPKSKNGECLFEIDNKNEKFTNLSRKCVSCWNKK